MRHLAPYCHGPIVDTKASAGLQKASVHFRAFSPLPLQLQRLAPGLLQLTDVPPLRDPLALYMMARISPSPAAVLALLGVSRLSHR